MPVQAIKDHAERSLRARGDDIVDLSHRIHAEPELGFDEHKASRWITEVLEDAGFTVDRGVADLPTAFVASAGTGELTVALCAEYDALPDIGHACGHNIIAGSSVAAALGLAAVADEIGVTVKVMGTPAEENGGGKILMLERGAFAGVHAAMMVHPSREEEVAPRALANSDMEVRYTGRSAHAASSPERGVNAADALTVAQVAVGLLRQHLPLDQLIHGITTRGGEAPNIVPAHTSALYYLRAAELEGLDELEQRVRHCFEGGAVATGCELDMHQVCPTYSHFEPDTDMVNYYRANRSASGEPGPTASASGRTDGSTDMANVSLALPAIQPMIAIESDGACNHEPEFAAHCVMPGADRALLEGAVALAWTGIDVASAPAIRARLLAGQRQVMDLRRT